MSVAEYTEEPDMSYWGWYLEDCKANNIKPSIKDYLVFLDEMASDHKEYYEGLDND